LIGEGKREKENLEQQLNKRRIEIVTVIEQTLQETHSKLLYIKDLKVKLSPDCLEFQHYNHNGACTAFTILFNPNALNQPLLDTTLTLQPLFNKLSSELLGKSKFEPLADKFMLSLETEITDEIKQDLKSFIERAISLSLARIARELS